MTDTPERLRERAKAIELAFFKPDRIEHPEKRPSLVELIATAMHEIEQAAERRGIERAKLTAAICRSTIPCGVDVDPMEVANIVQGDIVRHIDDLLPRRALPTTAEPAKGA